MPRFARTLAGELVQGVEAALGLGLAEPEFEMAQGLVFELINEAEVPDLGAIVVSIEKAAGLALDVRDYAQALAAARRTLAPFLMNPQIAPDAHLELAYEERVAGDEPD
jgi:hypothetical protein